MLKKREIKITSISTLTNETTHEEKNADNNGLLPTFVATADLFFFVFVYTPKTKQKQNNLKLHTSAKKEQSHNSFFLSLFH